MEAGREDLLSGRAELKGWERPRVTEMEGEGVEEKERKEEINRRKKRKNDRDQSSEGRGFREGGGEVYK